MPDDDFKQRAAARASWQGRKTTHAQSSGEEDLSGSTTAEERLAMMWELATTAWALTGKSDVEVPRAQMPGRIIRPGER